MDPVLARSLYELTLTDVIGGLCISSIMIAIVMMMLSDRTQAPSGSRSSTARNNSQTCSGLDTEVVL